MRADQPQKAGTPQPNRPKQLDAPQPAEWKHAAGQAGGQILCSVQRILTYPTLDYDELWLAKNQRHLSLLKQSVHHIYLSNLPILSTYSISIYINIAACI